jgi:molecular chaperone GrpE
MNDKRKDDAGTEPSAGPVETGAGENGATEQNQATAEDTVSIPATQWQQLQQQLNSQQEQVMRIKAEADNQLKREQRQLERHRQLALESIMRQLLEVRDSMEMGLQASVAAEQAGTDQASTAGQQLQALRNGMQMTLKLLDKTISDNGAEIIDPQGQPFDPEWHEAVSMQADSGMPRDTVVAVMQKGCRLHDRLLRPAMVIVAAG